MKRIINILLITLPLLLMQMSCTEDWLKPKPLSFYSPENVYVDEAGFRALLTTLRKDIKYEYYDVYNLSMLEFSASDLGIPTFQPDWTQLTPSGSFYLHLSMFNKAYEFIKNANVAVSRIDNIEWKDQQVRNSILAEALFFRSYWYYRLVNSYGDIPWVGEEISGAKLDFQTYSRWAIIDKIQRDMEFAVKWLPEKAAIGFVTKYAGLHLLTEIYLANTEFDKAIASATEVINGPYALMTTRFGSWATDKKRNVLWDLHRVENKGLAANKEAIFITIDRFVAPADAKASLGTFTMRNFVPSWWTIPDKTGGRGFDWNLAMGDTIGQGNSDSNANYFQSHSVWSEFGYNWKNTPDLRRCDINWVEMEELTFNNPKSPNYKQKCTWEYLIDKADTTWMWRAFPIYKTFVDPKFGRPEGRPRGGNGDYYVFRLAETYLLRAEAYFWKNQLALAAADINMVRQRSKANPISSGDVTIDYIFHERARELYTEERRHNEMVRVSNIMAKLNLSGYSLNNISEKNWYYDRVMKYNNWYSEPRYSRIGGPKAFISPYNIYWPIPQSIINANTMGRINQNIGYQGAENNVPPIETIE